MIDGLEQYEFSQPNSLFDLDIGLTPETFNKNLRYILNRYRIKDDDEINALISTSDRNFFQATSNLDVINLQTWKELVDLVLNFTLVSDKGSEAIVYKLKNNPDIIFRFPYNPYLPIIFEQLKNNTRSVEYVAERLTTIYKQPNQQNLTKITTEVIDNLIGNNRVFADPSLGDFKGLVMPTNQIVTLSGKPIAGLQVYIDYDFTKPDFRLTPSTISDALGIDFIGQNMARTNGHAFYIDLPGILLTLRNSIKITYADIVNRRLID